MQLGCKHIWTNSCALRLRVLLAVAGPLHQLLWGTISCNDFMQPCPCQTHPPLPPPSHRLGTAGGETRPRPKRWRPDLSIRVGSSAKAALGLGVLPPPDDAAFLAGVSGGPASAGRFLSPSNDFMQRLHATISCNDTNIGHDTKISGHQARCILY